jgi:N-acyl-D-aspartate/D-glutamate deacylase
MTKLLLRGADVVDGSGTPPRRVDVLVEDGRIVEVGPSVRDTEAETVDLGGLALAPGFIDIHTHLDAQVLWDPQLSPSSWHGVTTVLMGNCGLGLAPTRVPDRDAVLDMLVNVEGMSPRALVAGVRWQFETFPEYLEVLDRLPKRINVAALVGHSPVRRYVMGDAAAERAATTDEVAAMAAVVRSALDAGALGFSTSRAQGHVGGGGRPIPSRVADYDEIKTLAAELAGRGRGLVEAATGQGMFLPEFAELARITGRPITWGALLTGIDYDALIAGNLRPAAAGTRASALLDATSELGGDVLPQISCRELTTQFHLFEPFTLAKLPAFDQILRSDPSARPDLYRDPSWRAAARQQTDREWSQWWHRTRLAEADVDADLIGDTVIDIAAVRGCHPLDAVVDISLANDLRARFTVARANDDEEELARLLCDRRALLGLSDAGAHADQLCDAVFATYLLGTWVRERGVLPLEMAVWRITGHPASVLGLRDRGLIAPGYVADLVAFDPATVGTTEPRRVRDLPTGAERLVADPVGIEHTWVAGEAIVRTGRPVEASLPGRVVRS